jgi:hypothetical protein
MVWIQFVRAANTNQVLKNIQSRLKIINRDGGIFFLILNETIENFVVGEFRVGFFGGAV